MKISLLLSTLYSCSLVSAAATPCKRDTCYNNIAVNNGRNSNAAQRRADCSSALRTVINDDRTITITSYTTITPFTATISAVDTTITQFSLSTVSETLVSTFTETSTLPEVVVVVTKRGRDVSRSVDTPAQITPFPKRENSANEESLLEARDKIIVSGPKPAYASACKDIMAYATACLCFGIKAGTYREAPRTSLLKITVEATTTATVFVPETTVLVSFTTETVTSVTTSTTVRPFPTLDAVQISRLATSPGGRDIDIGGGGFMRALRTDFSTETLFRFEKTGSQPITIANQDSPSVPLQVRREQPQYGPLMLPVDTVMSDPGVNCIFDKDGFVACANTEDGNLRSFYICQTNLLYLAIPNWPFGEELCEPTRLKLKSLSYS